MDYRFVWGSTNLIICVCDNIVLNKQFTCKECKITLYTSHFLNKKKKKIENSSFILKKFKYIGYKICTKIQKYKWNKFTYSQCN